MRCAVASLVAGTTTFSGSVLMPSRSGEKVPDEVAFLPRDQRYHRDPINTEYFEFAQVGCDLLSRPDQTGGKTAGEECCERRSRLRRSDGDESPE